MRTKIREFFRRKSKAELMFAALAKGSNTLIAPPAVIAKLENQGIPIKRSGPPTLVARFKARRENASKVVNKLPDLPPVEFLPHSIKLLYEEILDCILFGLNGAAITLCGNLIEFTLKHAAFVKESGGYKKYDPDKWDQFEQIELAPAINRAKAAGLITSKMGKRLHSFREDIRNPYSHYNIRKITREVIAGRVKVANIETGEFEERDIPAVQDPAIQAVAKPMLDERNVLFVFHFANEVVTAVLSKLEEDLKAANA